MWKLILIWQREEQKKNNPEMKLRAQRTALVGCDGEDGRGKC